MHLNVAELFEKAKLLFNVDDDTWEDVPILNKCMDIYDGGERKECFLTIFQQPVRNYQEILIENKYNINLNLFDFLCDKGKDILLLPSRKMYKQIIFGDKKLTAIKYRNIIDSVVKEKTKDTTIENKFFGYTNLEKYNVSQVKEKVTGEVTGMVDRIDLNTIDQNKFYITALLDVDCLEFHDFIRMNTTPTILKSLEKTRGNIHEDIENSVTIHWLLTPGHKIKHLYQEWIADSE